MIDFGLAETLRQSLSDASLYTGVQQMVGTPLVVSPVHPLPASPNGHAVHNFLRAIGPQYGARRKGEWVVWEPLGAHSPALRVWICSVNTLHRVVQAQQSCDPADRHPGSWTRDCRLGESTREIKL